MLSTRPEHISEQTIKQSYWVLSHLTQWKKIAMRVLLIGEGLLIVLFLFQLFLYVYNLSLREETVLAPVRMLAQQSQHTLLLAPPVAKDQGAVQSALGLYDPFVIFINENQEWRADFDVIFSVNGAEQPPVHGFLFPNEQKPILIPSVTAASSPAVTSRITNLSWKRLSLSEKSLITERTPIEITTKSYANTSQGQFIGSRLAFTLANRSISHAYDFSMKAVVRRGDEVVAIKTVPIFSLLKGEERPFEARWVQAVDATSFDLYPDIDYLRDSSFQRAF